MPGAAAGATPVISAAMGAISEAMPDTWGTAGILAISMLSTMSGTSTTSATFTILTMEGPSLDSVEGHGGGMTLSLLPLSLSPHCPFTTILAPDLITVTIPPASTIPALPSPLSKKTVFTLEAAFLELDRHMLYAEFLRQKLLEAL